MTRTEPVTHLTPGRIKQELMAQYNSGQLTEDEAVRVIDWVSSNLCEVSLWSSMKLEDAIALASDMANDANFG